MKVCENLSKAGLIREIKTSVKRRAEPTERPQKSIARLQRKNEDVEYSLENSAGEEMENRLARDRLLMLESTRTAMEELAGNIAHQWRQPLNIIGLAVQKLQFDFERREVDGPYVTQMAGEVLDIVKQMSVTVRTFRDFLQIDRRKQRFDLKEALRRVTSFVGESMKSGDISLRMESCQEELPVDGYPNEFSCVMLNILNKSRKVLLEKKTASPRITVSLFRENSRPVVAIHDNGGCIPERLIDEIFEPYSTAGTRGAGTGMELYLAKTVIERKMGGKMTARNRDDGVEFRIEF